MEPARRVREKRPPSWCSSPSGTTPKITERARHLARHAQWTHSTTGGAQSTTGHWFNSSVTPTPPARRTSDRFDANRWSTYAQSRFSSRPAGSWHWDSRPRVSLIGLVYDPQDDIVEVALEGLDHMIHKPRELYVEEEGGDFPASRSSMRTVAGRS
jgi:hypothetical protein